MSDVTTTEDARPFSKEEYEAWVADCTLIEQRIKSAKRKGQEALWEMAQAMHEFDGQSGWRALGYDTIGEWLADPDITMTRSTYYRLISTFQELAVVRHVELPTLGVLDLSKVAIALPALKRGEVSTEDMLADAESLGARDLRIKYAAQPEMVPDEQTIDSDEDGEPVELPEPVEVSDGVDQEPAPWVVAQTLTVALEAVLHAVGRPSRKAMSVQMRSMVEDALAMAHEHGLGSHV